ncbi:unnamed protein product [Acanthocheilonema viteae]|uniref:Histone H2A n=1 Tax=Acanthocheilonema viteae TaxID=6277 RepID=A0A498SIJ7_ACAVI|nr:unnamed protein product [Acanthocheilonema viteae]
MNLDTIASFRDDALSIIQSVTYDKSGMREKRGNYAERIGVRVSVFLAAVLEYLSAEILEMAGNAAHANEKNRINLRHLQLAIQSDDELSALLSNVTVSQDSVLPNINSALLPKQPADMPSTST